VRLTNHAEETLQRGSALLAPLLLRRGFLFEVVDTGGSNGGQFASGEFRRGARRLKFHFRHGLGMATYHLADRSMTHKQYMCSVHRSLRASYYPGFSGDPLDAFQHLLLDLEEFESDFLGGTDDCLLGRINDALASPIQKSGLPE
jgi:hypothetical protein